MLNASPQQVRLCFNERVEARFSAVSLTDAAGVAVLLGTPVTDTAEPQCLVTPIGVTLPAGNYTVKYKVLSVDGHIVDYGYGFSLRMP